MGMESMLWYNTYNLVGFESTRGSAWHKDERIIQQIVAAGGESNHYPGAIPVDDVRRRLFSWEAAESSVINGTTLDVVDGVKNIYHPESGASFGIHSTQYKVHQYGDWLLEKPAQVVGASEGTLAVAGAGLLMSGGVAYVQIEAPSNVTVGGDALRPFILATTSHNGKYATTFKTGTVRVVCDNTLSYFHRSAGSGFRVKHTSNSIARLDDVRRALDLVFVEQSAELDMIDRLQNTPITDVIFGRLIETLDPLPTDEGRGRTLVLNKTAQLRNLWTNDLRVAPYKGTAYGAVQCYNTWNQHFATVKGAIRPERIKLDFMSGTTDKRDGDVLDALRSVCETFSVLVPA